MRSTCSCGKFPTARAKILSRVLVIDDEPLVRWSLVAGLRHAGFDAIAAGTPEEARALARQVPAPDVVLFDTRLWGADPGALLNEIRSASPHGRILILAVEGADVALPPGEQAEIIRKPFDLDSVVGRVREAAMCPMHGQKMAV